MFNVAVALNKYKGKMKTYSLELLKKECLIFYLSISASSACRFYSPIFIQCTPEEKLKPQITTHEPTAAYWVSGFSAYLHV